MTEEEAESHWKVLLGQFYDEQNAVDVNGLHTYDNSNWPTIDSSASCSTPPSPPPPAAGTGTFTLTSDDVSPAFEQHVSLSGSVIYSSLSQSYMGTGSLQYKCHRIPYNLDGSIDTNSRFYFEREGTMSNIAEITLSGDRRTLQVNVGGEVTSLPQGCTFNNFVPYNIVDGNIIAVGEFSDLAFKYNVFLSGPPCNWVNTCNTTP